MSIRKSARSLSVLVIDIGGSRVKARVSRSREKLGISSGRDMTPGQMVSAVKHAMADCAFDVVSIGYPGKVIRGVPCEDPPNLGKGWLDFNFARAFRCPVQVVNDAVMQALGAYHGGRMLFLGLGTGLGSALILNGAMHGLELGNLPYLNGKPCVEYVKKSTLKRIGRARWSLHVKRIVRVMADALQPDYTVLGGGQAKLVANPPRWVEVTDNSKAFIGGIRLWQPPAWFRRLAGADTR
jgi:polyphosphate glucokinase